jgi:hypothetical protein
VRRWPRRLVVVTLAIALAGGVGCRALGPGGEAGPVPRSLVQTWTLPPGSFIEVKLRMATGATLLLGFRAEGGPIDWDVHSHPAAGLAVHQWGRSVGVRTEFRAETAGEYFCLWTNDERAEEAVTLRVELHLRGDGGVVLVPPSPSRASPAAPSG